MEPVKVIEADPLLKAVDNDCDNLLQFTDIRSEKNTDIKAILLRNFSGSTTDPQKFQQRSLRKKYIAHRHKRHEDPNFVPQRFRAPSLPSLPYWKLF